MPKTIRHRQERLRTHMDKDASFKRAGHDGATVVITHRVREDKRADYETWLDEIAPLCRASPGHLDWHIIRPISGLTETYTVIIRFDTSAHLQDWMESPVRAGLIDKVRPLLVTGDDFFVSSGLDFWFTPAGAKARLPVRWKQFVVTWSAIYPLALGVPLVLTPVLQRVGMISNRFLTTLAVTGIVVFLMVYIVMPHYTRLVKRWLFS
jgi:antibiotic biosynthesis monooxygenase (ABM) superfamily enzyme